MIIANSLYLSVNVRELKTLTIEFMREFHFRSTINIQFSHSFIHSFMQTGGLAVT